MDIKEDKELSFDTQDFPKEVWVFDTDNLDQGTEISHLMMSHAEEYTKDELLVICRKASMVIDQLRTDLAKAQAVPEGCLLMQQNCTNKMAHSAKEVDGRLSAFKYANVYGAMVEAAQESIND